MGTQRCCYIAGAQYRCPRVNIPSCNSPSTHLQLHFASTPKNRGHEHSVNAPISFLSQKLRECAIILGERHKKKDPKHGNGNDTVSSVPNTAADPDCTAGILPAESSRSTEPLANLTIVLCGKEGHISSQRRKLPALTCLMLKKNRCSSLYPLPVLSNLDT